MFTPNFRIKKKCDVCDFSVAWIFVPKGWFENFRNC